MTENEAISMMRYRIDTASNILGKGTDGKAYEDLEMAISALKEIREYRKCGTLEELARAKKYINLAKKHETIGEMIDECAAYEEIGTVEECREAMEKQKPKKPHKNYEKFSGLWCKCGWYLGQKTCLDIKYCPNCGQAIRLGENKEGMRDE